MDAIDMQLLELLQKDARITVSDLSKKLNLSRPSVSERMARFQEQGIIEEYSARVSLKAIGKDTLLFIQIRSMKVSPLIFEEKIRGESDILECHRVTGEIDYFIKAAVSSLEDMRLLIDRLIPYGDLSTSIVIMSPLPYRHVVPRLKP